MNIRPLRDGDVNFILSTWLKSYYDALTTFSKRAQAKIAPPNEIFFKEHQEKIKAELLKSKCLVCVAPDEENQIIGYIVFDGDCLHYCYVKQVFRKMGVAKALSAKAQSLKHYSHHTPYSKYVNKGLVFNPYKF
jgi:hypothetical protein